MADCQRISLGWFHKPFSLYEFVVWDINDNGRQS